MIRHKVINGICYLYETKQEYKGRCVQHNKALESNSTERDAAAKLLLRIRSRAKFHKKDGKFSSVELSANDWYLLLDKLGIIIAGATWTEEATLDKGAKLEGDE